MKILVVEPEKSPYELEIPSPYAELIVKFANEQNTSVDDIAEKAIKHFLEMSKTNAGKREEGHNR